MEKFLIIDTFNFFHRAYYALPPTLTDKEGNPTNAVFGVASMLLNIFDLISPEYAVAALESKEEVKRKKEYEEYKAQRKPMDEELKQQIPPLFELLDSFGVHSITVSEYEADDVIGTLTQRFRDEVEIIIASNDRDLWQLVGGNVMVMSPRNGGNEADWIGKKEVRARYGFGPEYIADYKALTGDSSDNIPGVYGIGKVTATKLITKYGHLDDIYANLEDISGSVHKKLEEGRDDAFLSLKLAILACDLDINATLSDCVFEGLDKDSIREFLEEHAFYSLLKRLNNGVNSAGSDFEEGSEGNQPGLFD